MSTWSEYSWVTSLVVCVGHIGCFPSDERLVLKGWLDEKCLVTLKHMFVSPLNNSFVEEDRIAVKRLNYGTACSQSIVHCLMSLPSPHSLWPPCYYYYFFFLLLWWCTVVSTPQLWKRQISTHTEKKTPFCKQILFKIFFAHHRLWNVAQTTGITAVYWRRRKRHLAEKAGNTGVINFTVLFPQSKNKSYANMKLIFVCGVILFARKYLILKNLHTAY